MDNSILIDYIDKIYGYAINKTYSREEADELTQEILYTAVKELSKLKNPNCFEAWLWGVAKNVTRTFRRYLGKQRAMFSYNCLEELTVNDEYDFENDEIYNLLRTRIAMMSKIYRDIIIYYYYDNLSVKQIAQKLDIPEGTVTWRLSKGRSKLKKECTNMTKTVMQPIKMNIRINGGGDYNGTTIAFPHVFISDALSQNIFYHCYENARTIEELAKLCGVPAYYIESNIINLLKREALIESVKRKYQTNFIIYDNKVNEYSKTEDKYFKNIINDFISILRKFTDAVSKMKIYTAGKDRNELMYLYGLLALEKLSEEYNPIPYKPHPIRYDGNRWSYHAHLGTKQKYPAIGLGREESSNLGSRGSYKHISYHFGGFSYRPMMLADIINICEDILTNRPIKDTESVSKAIEKGFVKRESCGCLSVTVPAFTKEDKVKFDENVFGYFSPVIKDYVNAVSTYIDGYKELFPKHLEEDVLRACNFLFVTLFGSITRIAQEKGLLKLPKVNSICDVIIQHK